MIIRIMESRLLGYLVINSSSNKYSYPVMIHSLLNELKLVFLGQEVLVIRT